MIVEIWKDVEGYKVADFQWGKIHCRVILNKIIRG